MAAFDFLLCGANEPVRIEIAARDATELVNLISRERFLVGDAGPDEWGQIRRVVIPSSRINMVLEADQ